MKEKLFCVMLDVSRNAVMKVDQLKKFINYISSMGYNALGLYSEDMFKIDDIPELGYLRGAYTKEEIKELDSYALSKNITLIPFVQALAHFTNFKKLKAAKDIIDCNDILLVGEEKTYEFIDKIFKYISETFTSKRINIGFDEAHMLGLGKYLDRNGYKKRSDVFLEHLNRVATMAKKYGFTCDMWDDMFVRLANHGDYYVVDPKDIVFDPKIKEKIPDNINLVYWDYYSTRKEHYTKQLQLQTQLSENVVFAGGCHSWVGFAPANQLSIRSMKAGLEACKEFGVQNVIVTMWGDSSKEGSFFNLLPSLYATSEYYKGNFDLESIKKGFYEKFNLVFDDFLLLDSINFSADSKYESYDEIIQRAPFYNDVFVPVVNVYLSKINHIDYNLTAKKLRDAGKRNSTFEYLFIEQALLCEFLSYKHDLSFKIREYYSMHNTKKLKSLIKDFDGAIKSLDRLKEHFYKLYLLENKSYGIEIHNHRLGGLKERLIYTRRVLKDYLSGKIKCIEELEEALIETEDQLLITYKPLISPSEI